MRFITLISAAALLSLSACNRESPNRDEDEDRSSQSDENEDSADASDSGDKSGGGSAEGGDTELASLVIGTWTDNGQCDDTIEMRDDGSFVMFNGGEGEWEMDGDQLTLSGPNGRATMTVEMEGDDVMTLVHPDGQRGRSTRC